MTAIIVVISLLAVSVVAYFATKVNRILGSAITIISSLVILCIFLIKGDGIADNGTIGFLSFKVTSVGWYFTVIMLIVYSMASFFNPYWIKKILYPAAYNMLYLLSLAGTIGVFMAKDFIVLFFFWEIAVWSSMFIIPFGKSRKASVVYYAMSVFGSFLMLYAIFMLYVNYNSFDINEVLTRSASDPLIAIISFILILIAGMVKLGIFPFHIWIPMAQGNAPDIFSPVLSGGLEKLGAFIAVIIVTAYPAYKAFASQVTIMGMPIIIYIFMLIAAISIIVGTLMAIRQDDAKKLLAYSSIANGGYILLGILINDKMAMSGALIHILVHALASAAAFLVLAAVSHRTGTTKMSELGGLAHRMPVTFAVYVISILSIAGVPPMIGFISKWLLFQSLATNGLYFLAIAAFFGSVGSFLYVFRPLITMFLGQLSPKHSKIKEAPIGMLVPMCILSLITLVNGVYPTIIINYTAKIEKALGFKEVIKTNGLVIDGSNGDLNATFISGMFVIGFIISLIIFLRAPKSRKVDLMDTYTAGEFIYTPELYHYNVDFYAPLERLYEKHPKIIGLYEGLVERIKDLSKFIDYLIFSYLPNRGVLLTIVAIILLLWGEKLWL